MVTNYKNSVILALFRLLYTHLRRLPKYWIYVCHSYSTDGFRTCSKAEQFKVIFFDTTTATKFGNQPRFRKARRASRPFVRYGQFASGATGNAPKATQIETLEAQSARHSAMICAQGAPNGENFLAQGPANRSVRLSRGGKTSVASLRSPQIRPLGTASFFLDSRSVLQCKRQTHSQKLGKT